MSRESLVFTLGLVVFIVTFLGIPNDWKRLVFAIASVVLMYVGYSLRRSVFMRSFENERGEKMSDAFVESPENNS